MGDVDSHNMGPTLSFIVDQLGAKHVYVQPTRNGFHFYTNIRVSWRGLLYTLRRIPGIDPAWIGIGEIRGYFYLADKRAICLPWPVVRMTIYYHKEKQDGKT